MARSKLKTERVFQALGDATRRAIVERLSRRPYSVSGLAEPLEISVTAVAQHLQVLEQCGLVRTEKVGRVRTARLDSAGFSTLEDWIRDRRSLLEQQLDQLGALLEEDDDPLV